jgi:hypothetical protein
MFHLNIPIEGFIQPLKDFIQNYICGLTNIIAENIIIPCQLNPVHLPKINLFFYTSNMQLTSTAVSSKDAFTTKTRTYFPPTPHNLASLFPSGFN